MRVLQSFPEGRTTTNPYLLQLSRALCPHVEVLGFTWVRALTGRYDVLHVHWPEILLQGRTPARAFARRMLFRLFLARLWLSHIAVVRTVHNVLSHESVSRQEERLLDRFDHCTTLWIRLNPFTPLPVGALERTIAHGDYRAWYAAHTPGTPVPGRLLFFGLIRSYKGVDTLIHSFRQLDRDTADGVIPTLRIVGSPQPKELARRVQLQAAGDARIRCALHHASDVELADAISAAELVVLPYAEMHNSGAALLALSLNRPVLVPQNVVTRALANEVGPGWVLTYDGPLSAKILGDALVQARRPRSTPSPELSSRRWTRIASDHVEAYEYALHARRSR